jgi:hypothetical protein
MTSRVLCKCTGLLVGSLCLVAGCAPSPEVAHEGARRQQWDPSATRSPPPAEPEETSGDPPDQPGRDAAPPRSDAAAEGPEVGRAGADAGDAPPSAPGPPRPCTLVFQVTTATANGTYAPRNCGAIWVSDGDGRFVKSLTVWAQKRLRHLVAWQAASMGNSVDAVTSATKTTHGTRMANWDCTGLDHQPVPDGPYRINVEMTERNGAGRVMVPLEFIKDGAEVSLMPPDQPSFKGVRLQVTTP